MSTLTVIDLSNAPSAREFDEFFEAQYSWVYRTAYGITGSAADAEDVVQTVFLRVLRHRLTAAFQKNPKGYLYRVAVNLSVDVVRARKPLTLLTDLEDVTAPEVTPYFEVCGISRKQLSEALAMLNPRAVEVLVLHYQAGFSDAEIAKLLKTSRGVIAVSLFRARARLRKLLRASMEKKS